MIGKITPSGVLTEYSFLPAQIVLGGSSTVVDIIAGPDGNVWFTEPGNDLVGRITPSGNIIQYTFPSGTYPSSITAGPNGNVWFAGKAIGEITANGTVTLYASLSNTNILHITTGPDQNLWFTVQELSGNKTHIGTVVPNLLGSGQSMIVGTVQGTAFTGSVGTVTLTNPQGANASINWGDGHTTPGTLVPDGAGSFTITGTNIFQQPGNFPITISVVSPNGLHTTIKSTATVAASPYAGFVTQLYRDLLQRQPDAPGLQFWIQTLNQGTSRAQVVLDFQSSPEYRTDAVDHLYASLLGRVADPAGESGFVAFLNAGGALQQVEVAILVSPEYFQRAGGTIGGFLGAIYHDVLGRGLDPSGAMLYGQLLSMAPTLPMRSLVAGAVVGSAEANQDTVKNDYQTFLRRGVDSGGLNMFAGALDYGLPADMVLAAIVGSDEYFARFST